MTALVALIGALIAALGVALAGWWKAAKKVSHREVRLARELHEQKVSDSWHEMFTKSQTINQAWRDKAKEDPHAHDLADELARSVEPQD